MTRKTLYLVLALILVLGNSAFAGSKKPVYTSPDLALMGIYGQVKAVTITTTPCYDNGQWAGEELNTVQKITFDKNGQIMSASVDDNDIDLSGISRISKDRIISIAWGDGSSIFYYRFTWKGNRVVEYDEELCMEISVCNTYKLTYDKNGRVMSAQREGVSDGIEYSQKIKYDYTTSDSKGNWTVCERRIDDEKERIVRTIEYYE